MFGAPVPMSESKEIDAGKTDYRNILESVIRVVVWVMRKRDSE